MDSIEPTLYPIMRRELQSQGPRYVVQIGDKIVDYNSDFRLYITTRNTKPKLMPDAIAITTVVNFTTTRAGLSGQLLAATIQHEKPELETKKTDLLRTEEEFKIELAKLEDSLLEELASAKGNILENKELLESLNKTKESSATIEKSLEESIKLTDSLDKVIILNIFKYFFSNLNIGKRSLFAISRNWKQTLFRNQLFGLD